MEVKKDFKNDLCKRREVEIMIEADKNPNFVECSKMIADQFKDKEENVLVEKIAGKFGRNTFLVKASIYNTPEEKDVALKRRTKVKKEATPAQ